MIYYSRHIFKRKFTSLSKNKLIDLFSYLIENKVWYGFNPNDIRNIFQLRQNFYKDKRKKSKDEILEQLYRLLDLSMMESDRAKISKLIDIRLEYLESLELDENLYD